MPEQLDRLTLTHEDVRLLLRDGRLEKEWLELTLNVEGATPPPTSRTVPDGGAIDRIIRRVEDLERFVRSYGTRDNDVSDGWPDYVELSSVEYADGLVEPTESEMLEHIHDNMKRGVVHFDPTLKMKLELSSSVLKCLKNRGGVGIIEPVHPETSPPAGELLGHSALAVRVTERLAKASMLLVRSEYVAIDEVRKLVGDSFDEMKQADFRPLDLEQMAFLLRTAGWYIRKRDSYDDVTGDS